MANYQLWTQDNHPILLDTNSMMQQKLDYIHNNPVKAGLVYAGEDYVYSSASAFMGRESLLDLVFIE